MQSHRLHPEEPECYREQKVHLGIIRRIFNVTEGVTLHGHGLVHVRTQKLCVPNFHSMNAIYLTLCIPFQSFAEPPAACPMIHLSGTAVPCTTFRL